MKTNAIAFILLSLAVTADAAPLETGFNYQGELFFAGQAANGEFDFEFTLYDMASDGIAVSDTVVLENAAVSNGAFTAILDFGAGPFAGDQLWLEIQVREGTDSGALTPLVPRQKLSATPYALHAENVAAGAISAPQIASGAVGTSQINTQQVQRRIARSCGTDTFMVRVGQDGNVVCAEKYSDKEAFGAVLAQGGERSGLDADLLDGRQASEFVATAGDTMTGALTVSAPITGTMLEATIGGVRFPDGSVQSEAATGSTLPGQSCPAGLTIAGVSAGGDIQCGGGLRRQQSVFDTDPDSPPCCARGSISINAESLAAVTYIAGPNFGNKRLAFINCQTPSCDIFTSRDVVSSFDWAAGNAAVAHGSDGTRFIAYFNGSFDLALIRCNNEICSSNTSRVALPVSSINADAWVSLAVGNDGFPVMGVFTISGFRVVHCEDILCDAAPTVTEISATGRVGRNSAVTIGSDGLPFFSYYNDDLNTLQVLHCGNVACSSGNTVTTLTNSSNAGLYSDVVIGNGGLPLVAFVDESDRSIQVAQCLDISCSNFLRNITVPAPVVRRDLSLALGLDGVPVIGFVDTTGSDRIKVIRCMDATCTGFSGPYTVGESAGLSGIEIGPTGLPALAGETEVIHCGRYDCFNP